MFQRQRYLKNVKTEEVSGGEFTLYIDGGSKTAGLLKSTTGELSLAAYDSKRSATCRSRSNTHALKENCGVAEFSLAVSPTYCWTGKDLI